jgi:uncharacterized membrane protein YjfL (UPF0719 family)
MDLLYLVLGLAVIGVIIEAINKKVGIDPMIRWAIYVIVFFVMVFYLIRRFGGHVPNVMP